MRNTFILCALLIGGSAFAQSKTTEDLHKRYSGSMSLFFYNNTLRMLNQTDDKNFDELIKNIEKMKFLMIDKAGSFASADYKKLVSEYKSEAFEEIMSSRYQGKNFDVYLKESGGKTKGMVVLVNDSASLYVLDIVGSIALDKITSFYSSLDESTDIGKKIKEFTGSNSDRSKRRQDDDDDDN